MILYNITHGYIIYNIYIYIYTYIYVCMYNRYIYIYIYVYIGIYIYIYSIIIHGCNIDHVIWISKEIFWKNQIIILT